jgi:hypothetical protein
MAATVYPRDFWERCRDKNPHLWSSEHWHIWEAMAQVEGEGVRVVSARMSRGFAVRVMTETGERMVRVSHTTARRKTEEPNSCGGQCGVRLCRSVRVDACPIRVSGNR